MDLYYNIILHSDMKTIQSLAMTNKLLYDFLSQKYVWINKFQQDDFIIREYRLKPYQWINEYNAVKYSHEKTALILRKTQKPLHHLNNGIVVVCQDLNMLELFMPFDLTFTDAFIYFMFNSVPYIQIYLFNKEVIVKDIILLYSYDKIVDLLQTILYKWPTISMTNVIGQLL